MIIQRLGLKQIAVIAALAVTTLAVGAVTLLGNSAVQAQGSNVAASAAFDRAGFIRFDGVRGESQKEGYEGWSEIQSFSQVTQRPGVGTSSSRRRGDVKLNDITITKGLDTASTEIAEAVLTGKVYPKVEIHLTASYTDDGRVFYYRYTLTNAQVVSYSIGGATEDVPIEEIAINFQALEVVYVERDEDGAPVGEHSYEWNVERSARNR